MPQQMCPPYLSSRFGSLAGSRHCPHAELGGNRFGAYAPIRACIEESAICAECQLLLQVIETFKPGWIETHKDGQGLIQIEYRVEPMYEEGDFSYNPFRGFGENVRHSRSQSLKVVEESFSKAAFDRAAKWLSHCLEHDEACDLPNEEEFMPRHLIDVGSWDGSKEPFLFKPSKLAPYACLSYCWGSDTDGILQTTTANFASHCNLIPVSKMPLGIQDAITVCRGLKIPNLWVDSLCIAQDDSKAWLEDASQMDRIYTHSQLTIAALEPASCKSRFLGRQRFGDPEWQRRFIADVALVKDKAPLEIFIRGTIDMDSDMGKIASLDKRGWCLQESLLPNRRLCFNGDEMIWECLCRKICECGHILWRPQPFKFSKLATSLKSSRLRTKVKLSEPQPAITVIEQLRRGVPQNEPEYPKQACQGWRDIVMEYSKRSISRKRDKLNAVSGLAKLVGESLRKSPQGGDDDVAEEYLAGLWRREFHFDLTWKVEQSHPTMTSAKLTQTSMGKNARGNTELGIPSWSWASVDGPIAYGENSRTMKPVQLSVGEQF
ncbi:hypothetical protein G7Z17_g667 [Cylindrodendrum hubeiense]|uniref:Heterokaryon incompatibility domain-containing protein n=1 Tax=Cylindrodendrum hubeiense TaxID=595255 RepID=A0A9P5LMU6_9HYPO|nr:hypothetical protein G7Z17_g667 [Cylindrodendrum hubeiense]